MEVQHQTVVPVFGNVDAERRAIDLAGFSFDRHRRRSGGHGRCRRGDRGRIGRGRVSARRRRGWRGGVCGGCCLGRGTRSRGRAGSVSGRRRGWLAGLRLGRRLRARSGRRERKKQKPQSDAAQRSRQVRSFPLCEDECLPVTLVPSPGSRLLEFDANPAQTRVAPKETS
jgi:hypothetical protein